MRRQIAAEHQHMLIEGRTGDGKERAANAEKAGDEVSELAKEAAKSQNPTQADQEEVTAWNSLPSQQDIARRSRCGGGPYPLGEILTQSAYRSPNRFSCC
jgi:hypothetical protein